MKALLYHHNEDVRVEGRPRPVLVNPGDAAEYDPTFIITHHLPLDRAAEAYRVFDRKEDGVRKVVLQP